MPQRPDSRPENALMLALVLVGGALLVALILLMVGVFREGGSKQLVWYGVALVAAAGVAAYLILRRVRQLRRQRRPEWLETQSWHQGMVEQAQKGQPPGRGSSAVRPGPDSGTGPGKT